MSAPRGVGGLLWGGGLLQGVSAPRGCLLPGGCLLWGVCSGGCLLLGVCSWGVSTPVGGGIPVCTEADTPHEQNHIHL